MWQGLIDGIRQQHAFLDLFTKSWIGEYAARGGKIHCGKGCRGCCNLAVNTTLTEAVCIAGELTGEQSERVRTYTLKLRKNLAGVSDLKSYLRMHRKEMGFCPLLEPDGSCGIYHVRPLSCRSLLSTRESRWCAADFAQLSTGEKQNFIAGLDRGVVNFPTHYVAVLQESGQELEAEASRRMREKFGFSLYGSLPAFLFLIKDHRLQEFCATGRAEVGKLLAAAGMDNSLLIAFSGEVVDAGCR